MVKCAKCGIISSEDRLLSFHRFPLPSMLHGSLKARVWAKYCFPNSNWTSDEALVKLYKEHKMLCGNHFDDSSFTSSDRKRLNKFAIPTEARNILHLFQMEQNNLLSKKQQQEQATNNHKTLIESTECQIKSKHEILHAVTKQQIINKDLVESLEERMLMEVTPSSSQGTIQEVIKDTHKVQGVLKPIGMDKAHPTPKKQKLYKGCRQNKSEIVRLRMKLKDVKHSVQNILDAVTEEVNNLKCDQGSSFLLLLQSQLKTVHRKLR